MTERLKKEKERGIISFLNCKIDLSKKVFVPRIETEFWVKRAIGQIKELYGGRTSLKVLDIFAGTGCIGICALKNIKKVKVDFVDVSKEAVEEIKINLKLNKIPRTRYRIYQSSMFEKLKGREYDVIFANPPYVAKERISEVQKEVLKAEPKEALFAGKDGMYYIRKFLKKVKKYLKGKGVFFLEFDSLQKEKIQKILEKENFNFQFYKDQFKKYRWLKAAVKPRK